MIPSRIRALYRWTLLSLLSLTLGMTLGCGGGSSNQQQSSQPPPATPDFALTVNPATVTVFPNNGTPVSVSATATGGFTSQISVELKGLPTDVLASPATFTIGPGATESVILSASSGASTGTTAATITGTSGSLTHTVNMNVSVSQETVQTLPTRTRYLRDDAVTEYGYSVNTHWEVFNSATSRFFVADPNGNRVFVFDSATETEIGSIVVPGAYGIDQTPDGGTLYVGTLIGDVYTINPVTMTVTQRYMASQIGPSGFQAMTALPLSNGSVALLSVAVGIPSVDGSGSIAVWNPTNNSITIYGSSSIPMSQVCGALGSIGGFALSPDRTTIIAGSIAGDTVCEINASSGQSTYINSETTFIYWIVVSPDGNYIALPVYPGQVVVYNAHTLAKVNQFAVAGDTSSAASLIFSADSQTLFVPNSTNVYAYSVATGQLTGWLPNIVVEPTSGGGNVGPSANPNYEFADSTGLMVGPMEEGLGFLDTTKLQTGTVDSQFTNAYLTPATGPTSGGTQVEWSLPNDTQSFVPTIYFGGNQGSSASVSPVTAAVTTPPGDPGPVPVYLFAPDGGMQLIPDGFSYGPTILEVTPNASTADGGGTGVIYGYGFGSITPTTITTIPSGLSVTVGGVPATIVGFNGQAYNNIAPPFLLQSISYTIPQGTSGVSTNVTVTSTSGATVAASAVTYTPATQQYPLPGSQLMQGIYDPVRDLYYFTDTSRVQVFSLAQGQWLAPINIPAPTGTTQRLWGIALSPDSTKLAVTDAQADVVYLINPSNTSSIQTFAGPSQSGVTTQPAGVAISDTGIVYFTVAVEGVSSGNGFYQLDTNTGALTALGNGDPGLFSYAGSGDLYQRIEISSDNSRVFFNNDGYVFTIETATGTVSLPTLDQECCYGNYELALSSNQTQFEASSYLYDTSLNAESFLTMNDREALAISYVYGAKFSPDGTLLFQPSTSGIDVFDGRLGTLLTRIALPFALSTNYDALVEDGEDNKLIAITGTNGNGIAVVDLSSIAEPGPLPYAAGLRAQRLSWGGRSGSPGLPAEPSQTKNAQFGPRIIPHVTHLILRPSHATTPSQKF